MISWQTITQKAKSSPAITIAVARAEDEVVISALKQAHDLGLVNGILVGKKKALETELKKQNIPLNLFEIVNCETDEEAAKISVRLVKENRAQTLMKGMIGTSTLLKAVVDRETGLRVETSGRTSLLSHVLAAGIDDRFYFITDAGMNIAPDLNQKVSIIENAVLVAQHLGISEPKVAQICAVETVNPSMPCTVDAAEISKMCENGQIKGCLIGGPFGLDNAVSIEAARHKKITHPVAGHADILMVPDIEAGNILAKTLIYFSKAKVGGIIAGASAPIILLSRADDDATKLNSILLAKAIS